MAKIDETDRKILSILRKNARKHFTDIAEEMGVSEATVRNRIKCLERNDVIKKYTVDINPKELGFDMVAIIGLNVTPEYLLSSVNELRDIEEVKWAAKSTGDHMIMAEVWAEDGEGLSRVISKKIGNIEGIKDVRPAILLEKKEEKYEIDG
ncbi:MAG: Lrp/AsnC family transcriptional regulator [Thermoplasmata archaeon]